MIIICTPGWQGCKIACKRGLPFYLTWAGLPSWASLTQTVPKTTKYYLRWTKTNIILKIVHKKMPKILFGYLTRLPSTGSGWFAPRVCGTLKTMITSGICNFSSAARNCPSYKLRLYIWRQRIQGPKHERSRAQTHLSATNKHWGSLSNHLF